LAQSTLSIVVPAYCEERTLAEVISRIYSVPLPQSVDKDVIICDDGSTDATPLVIAELQQRFPTLRAYTSPINLGKGAAVRVGMKLARGDIILIQDADLELDPSDYPSLLAPFSDSTASVVYGSRFLRGGRQTTRRGRLANRFLTGLTNVLYGAHLTDMETAYKVLRREVLDDLELSCVRFDFEPEITARLLQRGHTIIEVPVSYTPRSVAHGKKIAWRDGLDAVYTLIRCKLSH